MSSPAPCSSNACIASHANMWLQLGQAVDDAVGKDDHDETWESDVGTDEDLVILPPGNETWGSETTWSADSLYDPTEDLEIEASLQVMKRQQLFWMPHRNDLARWLAAGLLRR